MTAIMPGLSSRPVSSSQQQLASIVSRWTRQQGIQDSAIDGVDLIRSDQPTDCSPSVYEPSLCFIIQGTKTILLGDRRIVYTPLTYLASSVHLPILGRVESATHELPYLAAKLTIPSEEVADLLLELGDKVPRYDIGGEACSEVECGLCMSPMDEAMQDSLYRLLRLLDTPEDIPVLAPLARREILYRSLMGEMGPRMRKFAATDSQAHRISRVISELTDRYDQPLRVGELARSANMSESTLYHTFKQVTRMSPLQFQKKLRLHEARRLMLAEGLDAATASYRVGYESPSHFSREYSRLFGAPPRADVVQLRGQTMAPA